MGAVLGIPEPSVMPRLVCIEGNIGSGKSSCLSVLRDMGYTVYTEPIETEWAHFFKLKGQNPERWSFSFQVRVLCTLERQKHEARTSIGPFKGNVIFFERSPKACLAFSRLAYTHEFITAQELNLLVEMCTALDSGADDHIYLDSSDPSCLGRMVERGRPEEKTMALHDLALTRQAMENENLHTTSVDANGTVEQTVKNVLGAIGLGSGE